MVTKLGITADNYRKVPMKILLVSSMAVFGLYRYVTYGIAGIVPPIPGGRRMFGGRVGAARERRMTAS